MLQYQDMDMDDILETCVVQNHSRTYVNNGTHFNRPQNNYRQGSQYRHIRSSTNRTYSPQRGSNFDGKNDYEPRCSSVVSLPEQDPSNLTVEKLVDFVMKNYCTRSDYTAPDSVPTHNDQTNKCTPKATDESSDNNLNHLQNYFDRNYAKRMMELFGEHSKKINVANVPKKMKNIDGQTTMDIDVSLCSSILSCILEKFDIQCIDDQTICITKFFSKILSEVKKRKGTTRHEAQKFDWNKKALIDDITKQQMSDNVVAYVITYLNLNMFVISCDTITLYCTGDNYNIHKQNIVIYFDETTYAPLLYDNNKFWKYDVPLKMFIDSHKSEIRLFQSGGKKVGIFKIGYDGDVETIWENTDKTTEQTDVKSDALHVALRGMQCIRTDDKPNAPKMDTKKGSVAMPETTEQVLDAVFYKETHDNASETENVSETENASDLACDEQPESDMKPNKTKPDDQHVSQKETINFEKMKCVDVRKLASSRGIKLSLKKDGKVKQKTKQELIDEINSL